MSPSILTDHSPKYLAPPSLVSRSMGDPQQCIQARVARLNALFYSNKTRQLKKTQMFCNKFDLFPLIDITLNRKLELMLIQFQSVNLVSHSSSLTLIDFQL